jgi:hypothetical protein
MSEVINETSAPVEETLDILSQEDEVEETTEETPEPEVESEPEDEIELPKDEEEEVEELPKEDDQLELTTPVRRKEILQKYPNLFKDFPYLEKAYYREQQFTEVLPTIEDAKIAVEKAETLDNFEKDLMTGSTETILKSVKEGSQEAFNKLVDNYLPTLAKVDPQAFQHVVGNVTKHTIMAMFREGQESSNEALKNAALVLNQFVFGTSNFTAPAPLAKPDEAKAEIQSERQKFLQERFEIAKTELGTKITNTLKATIEQNIDPRKSMTDYVRRNAMRDAQEQLNQLIQKDTRFRQIYDKMWEKAFQSNFSKESMDRLRSAYFSKAKTLLPTVIKQARNEALKGLGRKSPDEVDRKGPLPVGKTATQSRSSSPKSVPKNMSTLDFFMQE